MILLGDCLEQMKSLEPNSVDAIVSDPPYGISFMGRRWDYDVPSVDIWREALRVLKPGGHVLSFGGTRTYHRMAVNIEDAGFEIRDQIQWLYGVGFPKSTNVLKSGIKQGIFCGCKTLSEQQLRPLPGADLSPSFTEKEAAFDSLQSSLSEQSLSQSMLRAQSEKRTASGEKPSLERRGDLQANEGQLHRSEILEVPEGISGDGPQRQLHNGTSPSNGETSGATSQSDRGGSSQRPQHSKQSHLQSGIIPEQPSPQTCGSCGKALCDEGLGSALKPANEPICLARKPLEKGLTLAENVLKWGTGALNIDGTRIGSREKQQFTGAKRVSANAGYAQDYVNPNIYPGSEVPLPDGRWPANVLFDEDAAAELDEQSGTLKSGGKQGASYKNENDGIFTPGGFQTTQFAGSSGGASRFFYVAKASKSERNRGLDGMPSKDRPLAISQWENQTNGSGEVMGPSKPQQNFHPTVKPIKLMEYLITLITPLNGTVLDPFMGSGSTGVAAKNLNREFIGIEMNQEYFEIAKKRIG